MRFSSLQLVSRVAAAAVLMASVAVSSAQTYLFDFGAGGTTTVNGPSPDDPVNFWNNITDTIGTSPTGQLTNIVSSANAPSTIGFAILSRFNAANGNGTTAASQFPLDATRDSLFGNTESFNGLANIFPSFKLTGLDPAAAYDLTFYASRAGISDNREAGYTVTGANNGFAALNAANNVTNVTTVVAIHPTASGEITVSIAPTANNNNTANHFTYLGVLKVFAAPPQTPMGFTLQPVNTQVVELTPVTFSAAVTGSAPYFIQWFSNNVPIPGANQLSYSIPSVTLAMDGSTFSVNVSNLAYSITSTNATLHVLNDTTPPSIVSISSIDGFTVNVCFNEALRVGEAEYEINYLVNENNGDIFPIDAVLEPNGKCVVLTLPPDLKISGTFTLSTWYLRDLAGNEIPFSTMATGEVSVAERQMILIDFGGVNVTDHGSAPVDDPLRYWNNVTTTVGTSDTAQLASLVTTQNLATSIGLSMLSRFNGANENGTTLTNSGYPTDATRDSLYGNTELFNNQTNIYPSFKLTGLTQTQAYTLTFYASRTGVADVRETQYTVAGATTNIAYLDAANNVTNVAVVSGMRANASGEIQINLTPGPNNTNANHFTYLGVLGIVPAPLGAQFLAPTKIGGSISLQWTGSGRLEWGPTVFGPWTPITPSSANAHSEPIDMATNRFFRLLP